MQIRLFLQIHQLFGQLAIGLAGFNEGGFGLLVLLDCFPQNLNLKLPLSEKFGILVRPNGLFLQRLAKPLHFGLQVVRPFSEGAYR